MRNKKVTIILSAACASLLLAACGNNKYEKYDDLINYLEAGDYESAYAEVAGLEQLNKDKEKKETKTKEVDITMDNWQDYFEIQKAANVNKDDFDEISGIEFGYYFVPKKEVEEQLLEANVAVAYLFSDYEYYPWEYDQETEEVTVGAAYSAEEVQSKGLYQWFNPETTEEGTFTYEIGEWTENFKSAIRTNYCDLDRLTMEGNTTKWDGELGSKAEVTKIKGTITIEEE